MCAGGRHEFPRSGEAGGRLSCCHDGAYAIIKRLRPGGIGLYSGCMQPFWKTKTLAEMTRAEWESLCDGCGRCCLHKLRDDETGAVWWTNVSCRLLDTTACRCTHYAERRRLVPDCVRLTPQNLAEI